MLAVLATAVIIQGAGYTAGKFEFGERYRALDVAWSQCKDISQKMATIPSIETAMAAFRVSNFSEGSRALDAALAELGGRKPTPADAMSLRFVPAYAEPGAKANLMVSWAYAPAQIAPVLLSVGGRSVSVLPGRSLTLQLDPAKSNPELRINLESGYLMSATIGGTPRSALISIVKHARDRITALKESKNMAARWLALRLEQAVAKPQNEWQETPVIEWLFLAERIDGGQLPLDRVQEMPYVQHRGSIFRVALPLLQATGNVEKPTNAVIAFGGEVGGENAWFESFGRGLAVSEAVGRSWVFVSLRNDPRAYENALDWLTRVRHVRLDQVFIMALGADADQALVTLQSSKKPFAAGLFGPELKEAPVVPLGVPTLIAIGKQDPAWNQEWLQQARAFASPKSLEFLERDACERQMIASESVVGAYKFFDSLLGP